MPSILDDNKTRFETAMEIFAAQLRFSRFTSEFKNYSEMEATIKKFIHSYLNDFGVRIKFLQHVREQLEMKMDLLETFIPDRTFIFFIFIKSLKNKKFAFKAWLI